MSLSYAPQDWMTHLYNMKKILILCSGMSAKEINHYDYIDNGWEIVAVSNGWRICNDWKYWIAADDFAGPKPKLSEGQSNPHHVPALEQFGGHLACGYSITLSAAYYALGELNPDVMGFLGADMIYTPDKDGNTHFYGVGYDITAYGKPDPDRMIERWGNGDENYLTNVYQRFAEQAKLRNTSVYNFSSLLETRLPYPQISPIYIDIGYLQ